MKIKVEDQRNEGEVLLVEFGVSSLRSSRRRRRPSSGTILACLSHRLWAERPCWPPTSRQSVRGARACWSIASPCSTS